MHHLLLIFIVCFLETAIGVSYRLRDTVDLTWTFDNDTVYWTDNQSFVIGKKIAEIRRDGIWYAGNEFCANEHGGTHFDAPFRFYRRGWKVADVPLSRLIVPGVHIDISKEVRLLKDRARLLPEHLDKWEEVHGSIPTNSVLLINFGWSKYYSNKTQYLGIDSENNLNFPGISDAAGQWIVKSGKIVGIGVDTAGIDAGRELEFPVHRALSLSQIYVLENVKIPSVFPATGFILYVMPMKIHGSAGAPLRLIAVPYDSALPSVPAPVPDIPKVNYAIVILSSMVLLFLYATQD